MNTLIEQIEKAISDIDTAAAKKNVGHITYIADGVARIEGLSEVMYHEMVALPGGVFGIALNLEEDEVGCIIVGDFSHLKENDPVERTGRLLSVAVGKGLLGRVVDALGKPLDGKGPIASEETDAVEKIAPGIVVRKSVNQSLQTGIMAIDSMIPIGRGQRELIIGDRQTGKSTLVIDTILNQARLNRQGRERGDPDFRPVYSVYVAIGQKNANIARTLAVLEEAGSMEDTIVVAAPAADNPANQYIAPFAGTTMAEWFMRNGMDALIAYDDLSKHAVAYRQISLVLKRPPGREAYPGDIFYLHSRLLERSARLNEKQGNGSVTALPIIETQAGDVTAYIPTNVISITDGQIFLETDLFNKGIRPAISIGLSVSRVGSAAQIKACKQVAGRIKLELAQYRELAAFAQFASELDARTKAQLDRGARIIELFKQSAFQPKPIEIQIGLLWALQKGYFDPIAVADIVEASAHLEDFLSLRKEALITAIRTEGAITETIKTELKQALEEWKGLFEAKG